MVPSDPQGGGTTTGGSPYTGGGGGPGDLPSQPTGPDGPAPAPAPIVSLEAGPCKDMQTGAPVPDCTPCVDGDFNPCHKNAFCEKGPVNDVDKISVATCMCAHGFEGNGISCSPRHGYEFDGTMKI